MSDDAKPTDDPRIYFAVKDAQSCVRACSERFEEFQQRLATTGIAEQAQQAHARFYGRGADGTTPTNRLVRAGDNGEVVVLSYNGLRPLVQQVRSLIAGKRPGMKPIPVNADSADVEQASVAEQLADFYTQQLDLASLEVEAVLGGLLHTSIWKIEGWNKSLGKKLVDDVDTGRPIYEGDVESFLVPYWRAACDMTASTPDTRQWVLFRRHANIFDLAGRIKDETTRSKLLDMAGGAAAAEDSSSLFISRMKQQAGGEGSMGQDFKPRDAVWVWELRHRPSESCGPGRLLRYVNEDVILYDSASAMSEETGQLENAGYPYDDLHAFQYTPERQVGSDNLGDTNTFTLLPLAEMHDVATTAAASNVQAHGVISLWSKAGMGTTSQRVPGGPTIFESAEKPEVLDFPALKPEVMDFATLLRELGRESQAINDVVMGQPDKGMPASAQALQRAQAQAFAQIPQGGYYKMVAAGMTSVLKLCKKFAKTERVSSIIGKAGAYKLLTWSADKLKHFDRFEVIPVDAESQSYEGRVAFADAMAERGWLSREGYMSMRRTGKLEETLNPEEQLSDMLRRHCELLQEGIGLPPVDIAASQAQAEERAKQTGVFTMEPIFVEPKGGKAVRLLKTDPHWVAYTKYQSVLYNPAARANPKVVPAVLGVLQETLRLWASLTPDELQAAGGQPLPSQLAMQAPMPGEEDPNAPQAPSGPGPADGEPAAPSSGRDVPLPKPPANPLTGAREGTESLGGLAQ